MRNFKTKGKFRLQRWFSSSVRAGVRKSLFFFQSLRIYMVHTGLVCRESVLICAAVTTKKQLWHNAPQKWTCWSVRYVSSWCPSPSPCRADTRSAGGVSEARSHPDVHHAKRDSNKERWKTSATTSCSSASLKSAVPTRQRWNATFRRSWKPTNSRKRYASPPRGLT